MPEPPYYAVVFSSQRSLEDGPEYEQMARRMSELASTMPGYLGIESARGENGFGITVSYWESAEHIESWRSNIEHQVAQALGRERFYASFALRVCKVERAYSFVR